MLSSVFWIIPIDFRNSSCVHNSNFASVFFVLLVLLSTILVVVLALIFFFDDIIFFELIYKWRKVFSFLLSRFDLFFLSFFSSCLLSFFLFFLFQVL